MLDLNYDNILFAACFFSTNVHCNCLTLLQKMLKKWMALPNLVEVRMQRWVILSCLVPVILFLF